MPITIHEDAVREAVRTQTRARRESLRHSASAEALRPPRNDLLPGLKLSLWAREDLSPPKRAVRKLPKAQVQRLKTSIAAFGFCAPILIDKTGVIVDGVARFEAARQLGLDAIPCIAIDHLSEDELRALRLALNRIGEQGEWDFGELKIELSELIMLDAPLEATGFSFPQIEALLLDEADADTLPEPDPKQPVVSKLGDIWRCGRHLIACADARDDAVYAQLMNGEHARLVLTDEPFNVPIGGNVTNGDHAEFAMASGEMSREQFEVFNNAWMTPCVAHLAPGGLMATFIDWRSVELVLASGRSLGLELLNLIVWAKTNGGQGALWRSQHELLPVFKKPGGKHINNIELSRHGRYRTNLWQYPGASSLGSDARAGLSDHPTVKPVALLEDALLDVTNPNDLVLEPFCGSGSTPIACERTGRRCRAIEIEPAYVDLAVRRWQELTGKVAMHHITGVAFDEAANGAIEITMVEDGDEQ